MGQVALPLALFGLSTGISIYSGMKQADAQKDIAASNKKYYYAIADQSDQEARLIGDQGSRDVISIMEGAEGVQSGQRAAMAAAGVGGGSVTAEEIIKDTANQAYLDEMAVRYNADMAVWNKKNEAKNYRMAGDNAVEAGNINANTTLLTTASSVASKWLDYGSASGWGLKGASGRTISTRNLRSSNSELNLWNGKL